MLNLLSQTGVRSCDGVSRRDFLRIGSVAAGAWGLSLADLAGAKAPSRNDVNCILLFLVGGPSQLDTWDPKPQAPEEIRGPFRPIRTNVTGIHICENFPLMARMADRYAIVRSVHHDEAPIHETGQQLMQTGRLETDGTEAPHIGAVVSADQGRSDPNRPSFVILPKPLGNTGVNVGHGQTAGTLGTDHEPFYLQANVSDLDPARLSHPKSLLSAIDEAHRICDANEYLLKRGPEADALASLFSTGSKRGFAIAAESDGLRDTYGWNTFGQSCLLARRLVEHGVRLVTVNMFDTVFNQITWDCHADAPALPSRLEDYRNFLCPIFDRAYTALLTDLVQRGLLETTLVVALGEFGRTPRINPRGGRDHWPGVWSILFAGGGTRGGQVIGASDGIGAAPKERPLTPEEVVATIYCAMGVDWRGAAPISDVCS